MDRTDVLKVVCPACRKRIEARAWDGRVKGYCAVGRQYVNFSVEADLSRKNYRQDPEYRAKMAAATRIMWQDPEYRAKQRAAQNNKVAESP